MYFGQQQVVRVNGEPGARTYQMGPNCSALLLDENNPIVWLVCTDGAGYKTVTPYKIEQYVPEPEPDLASIMERLERLEARLNESNFAKNERKQSESKRTERTCGSDEDA